MDFSNIRKWMLKMDNILELYGKDESFTESEKNLLLDYTKRLSDAISALEVEDQTNIEAQKQDISASAVIIATNQKDKPKTQDGHSNHVSEDHAMPRPGSDKFVELFQFKKVEDLSEKLDSTPIDNIQKALGLNARILAQNELFKGDKVSFDNTVQKLDSLIHFEDAKSFLCDQIIPVFDWTHEDRLKKAQEFIKLVRRRYR